MTQLVKHHEVLPSKLTIKQAMYLLKTVWPRAPEPEVVRAAMICYQYGLNPLLKQIFLIPFKTKAGGETWSVVLGINATRLIAQQNGRHYSYDDGPRVMTEEEIKIIYGKVDNDRIRAITKIKDAQGNIFPGYGFWLYSDSVYGSDKGNSPINMAFIRSERNALDKMAPGELPNLDVTDEAYGPVNMQAAIAEGKKEFIEATEKEVDDLWPEGDKPEAPASDDLRRQIADMAIEKELVKQTRAFMQEKFGTDVTSGLSESQALSVLAKLKSGEIDGPF